MTSRIKPKRRKTRPQTPGSNVDFYRDRAPSDVGDFAVDAGFDDMDGTEEELIAQLTRGYGTED